MCLAVPAKVVAIKDAMGTVDIAGVTRDVSLMLLPGMVEQALTELKNWGIEPKVRTDVADLDYNKVAEDFSAIR